MHIFNTFCAGIYQNISMLYENNIILLDGNELMSLVGGAEFSFYPVTTAVLWLNLCRRRRRS